MTGRVARVPVTRRSALIGASSDYLNEMFTYQKKWSKLFRLSEAKNKQARCIIIAIHLTRAAAGGAVRDAGQGAHCA